MTAKDFWAAFKPEMEAVGDARLALAKAGVTKVGISLQPDGTLRMDLSGTNVEDLGLLHGLPVSYLSLYNRRKVMDLTPLRGLPLVHLNATNSGVTDLTPLRGLPLTEIFLANTPVTSVAPLLDCPSLESITLPHSAHDIELLRKLPKLRLLSYVTESASNLPSKTAEQFWKELDAQKKAVPVK